MDKEKYGLKWTDASQTSVYAEITKESMQKLFQECGLEIVNEDGKEDNSYIQGEAQFLFDSDNKLNEVLIYPVYCHGNGLVNGENFVYAPHEFWDLEEEAKQLLEKGEIER